MIQFIKRLFRSKDHWLKEYLADQEAPAIEVNGRGLPKEVQRPTEDEFKMRGEAATATYPSGLSFQELNRARVELGDIADPADAIDPEDADGIRDALAHGDLYGSMAYLRQTKLEQEYVKVKGSEAEADITERVQPLLYRPNTEGVGEDGKLPPIEVVEDHVNYDVHD